MKVQGLSGAKVIKVYGYPGQNPEEGIKIGDVSEDDLRSVLIEVAGQSNPKTSCLLGVYLEL
jgi:hypothetical protein